ncbi:MAG: hypothetical protein R2682_11775 [Pyrinomonadaceae bacterium]
MMLRFSALSAFFILSFCLVCSTRAQAPAKIAEIQARAFESRTGTFSENLIGSGARELGNMPSGPNASVSTFIIVKVQFGKDSPVPAAAKVRLVATETGSTPFSSNSKTQRRKIILDTSSSLGPADSDGTTYVGFWLERTDCRTIVLNASLRGVAGATSMVETLPFTCYE